MVFTCLFWLKWLQNTVTAKNIKYLLKINKRTVHFDTLHSKIQRKSRNRLVLVCSQMYISNTYNCTTIQLMWWPIVSVSVSHWVTQILLVGFNWNFTKRYLIFFWVKRVKCRFDGSHRLQKYDDRSYEVLSKSTRNYNKSQIKIF